jgi:GT2 family glycosyltransferase/glycosyltransferase involved in cell wall biosynthesis
MTRLHVVHGFPPELLGGTEQYVAQLAEAQARAGHAVAVLAGTLAAADPPALDEACQGPVRVLRYRGLPGRQHHWSEFADPAVEALLRECLTRVRPSVLHVHHWARLSSRVVAVGAAMGIPAVVTLHDTWAVCPRSFRLREDLTYCEEPYTPTLCQTCVPRHPWQGDAEVAALLALRHRLLHTELNTAAALIVPSAAHRDLLARTAGLPRERFQILPHPPLRALQPLPGPRPAGGEGRPFRIGCLGALAPHKGQEVLLRALPLLPRVPAWELHVFGSPEHRAYYDGLRALAQGFPVHFHGPYRPDALPAADLDVVVLPALAPESFSFTLEEVLQCGLPVIVSDRGALAERAGAAGLSVPAADPAALARVLCHLLTHPAELAARRAAAQGRRAATWDAHLAALEALYAGAAARPLPRDAADAGDPGPELRLRHRQVAEREAQLWALDAQRAHLAARLARLEGRMHLLTALAERATWAERALHVTTQTRGWRALCFLRELAAPRRPSMARARELLGLLRACLPPATPPPPAGTPPGDLEWQYRLWRARHAPDPATLAAWRAEARRLAYRPLISVITPVYDVSEAELRAALDSVRAQVYDHWQLCLVNDRSPAPHVRRLLDAAAAADPRVRLRHLPVHRGIVGASNAALELATGEFVAFLDHDDVLAPHALFTVVRHLNRHPADDILYSDEDKLDPEGRHCQPAFKPDWSPDLFRSMNYVGHLCVLRTSLVRKVDGFREGFDGSQDYDLLLRLTELTDRIAHLPDVLYHWRMTPGSTAAHTEAKRYAYDAAARALADSLARRGLAGRVRHAGPGRYSTRYAIRGTPLVSVIVPMRDRAALTRRCLESLEHRTTYRPWELVLVDNGSAEPDAVALLAEVARHHTVLRHEAPFNFSALVNRGAAAARGHYLLLLNNDTEVISPDWMSALLEHAQRPEVGAVGARLLYPDGRIQHAGVFIQGLPLQTASHRFKYLPARDPGYLALPRLTANCIAVTAACLMVRRELFEAVRGFDEAFRVALGDVDFCLRLRDLGLWIVYTPLATLFHHESASRGALHPPEDDRVFRDRWRRFFEGERDPFWSPHLSTETERVELLI